jgi:hypothetical protein
VIHVLNIKIDDDVEYEEDEIIMAFSRFTGGPGTSASYIAKFFSTSVFKGFGDDDKVYSVGYQ